jgi:hypothetical protein
MALIRHLRGRFRVRLGAGHRIEQPRFQVAKRDQPAAAARATPLVPDQVDRLAHGQDEEKLPEVDAVLEEGEPAALDAPEEAVEGAQRHVLPVGQAHRGVHPGVGQADQAVEIRLPETLGRLAVTLLELGDQVRDRPLRRHPRLPWGE